jgi:hypothetical protein
LADLPLFFHMLFSWIPTEDVQGKVLGVRQAKRDRKGAARASRRGPPMKLADRVLNCYNSTLRSASLSRGSTLFAIRRSALFGLYASLVLGRFSTSPKGTLDPNNLTIETSSTRSWVAEDRLVPSQTGFCVVIDFPGPKKPPPPHSKTAIARAEHPIDP